MTPTQTAAAALDAARDAYHVALDSAADRAAARDAYYAAIDALNADRADQAAQKRFE